MTAAGWSGYGSIASPDDRNIQNTIVVAPDGDDTNDGRTFGKALRTLAAAQQAAVELAGGLGPTIPGTTVEPTLILVYPGTYETKGHVDWPDRCTVLGMGGARKTRVVPSPGDLEADSYSTRNVFRLGDAGYVEGFSFENWTVGNPQQFPLQPFEDPVEGFAVAFRPGAIINRVPYAHNITAYTPFPPRQLITSPLDFRGGNPQVGPGGGVALADGSVISAYSAFPNIMTWGATPSTPNGVGYYARRGGMLNPINAICIFAHKHFMVSGGAQMVLSGCSSQFGDWSLWSEGYSYSPVPVKTAGPLILDSVAAGLIRTNMAQLLDDMWTHVQFMMSQNGGVWCGCGCGASVGSPAYLAKVKAYSDFDTKMLLTAVSNCLTSATQRPINQFFRGMHKWDGDLVFASDCVDEYIESWNWLLNTRLPQLFSSGGVALDTDNMILGLWQTLAHGMGATGFPPPPAKRLERSLLTAINHQWTQPMSGVTRDAVPSRFRNSGKARAIERSIKARNGGRVRFSGQDDEGNATFVGGLRIDSRSGELQGPPFDAAVRNRAIRTSLARSF
jgi:hypothetical protein